MDLPRDALLARYMLLSRVRLSVRLSEAGIVSKRLDESTWVLAWGLPSTYPTPCYTDIWVSPKIRVLPSGTLPKLRQVDRGCFVHFVRLATTLLCSCAEHLTVESYTIIISLQSYLYYWYPKGTSLRTAVVWLAAWRSG